MCGSSIQGVDESDGLKIDGWFMGRKIGKGASGKVFLAKNAKTGKVFRRPKYFFLDPYENKHTGKLAAIKVCPLNKLKQVKRDGMMVYPEVYVWKDMVRSIRARIFFFLVRLLRVGECQLLPPPPRKAQQILLLLSLKEAH